MFLIVCSGVDWSSDGGAGLAKGRRGMHNARVVCHWSCDILPDLIWAEMSLDPMTRGTRGELGLDSEWWGMVGLGFSEREREIEREWSVVGRVKKSFV